MVLAKTVKFEESLEVDASACNAKKSPDDSSVSNFYTGKDAAPVTIISIDVVPSLEHTLVNSSPCPEDK